MAISPINGHFFGAILCYTKWLADVASIFYCWFIKSLCTRRCGIWLNAVKVLFSSTQSVV